MIDIGEVMELRERLNGLTYDYCDFNDSDLKVFDGIVNELERLQEKEKPMKLKPEVTKQDLRMFCTENDGKFYTSREVIFCAKIDFETKEITTVFLNTKTGKPEDVVIERLNKLIIDSDLVEESK